jgi:thiol:disulfide interchange protein DsbA
MKFRWMALVAATLVSGAAFAQGAAPARGPIEAGKQYRLLSPAQPTGADAGQVEVAEVFMFGCPGCYALEPHLQAWLAHKPAYVSFIRIPAQWNSVAELHARAFYTAEALGKTDEIDGPFFDEFHAKGNHLDTEEKLTEFFGRFGIDAAKFKSTFYSSEIETKLKRALELVQGSKIPSTPTVVVNGKYLTNGSMAGTYDDWFSIIDELAAREHGAP